MLKTPTRFLLTCALTLGTATSLTSAYASGPAINNEKTPFERTLEQGYADRIAFYTTVKHNLVPTLMKESAEADNDALAPFQSLKAHENHDWAVDYARVHETLYAGGAVIDPEHSANMILALADEANALTQNKPLPVPVGNHTISGTVLMAHNALMQNAQKIEESRNEKGIGSIFPIRYSTAGGDINNEQGIAIRQLVGRIKNGDAYTTILLQGTKDRLLYTRRAENLKEILTNFGIPANRIAIINMPGRQWIYKSTNPDQSWITIRPDEVTP